MKKIILLLAILLSLHTLTLKAQNPHLTVLNFSSHHNKLEDEEKGLRHHISVNGTPNAFLLYKFNNNPAYIGVSLLPELEYSYDLFKEKDRKTRFYMSLL